MVLAGASRSLRRPLAALAETIPIRLDDNLTVPMTAAGVLWAALVDATDAIAAAAAHPCRTFPIGGGAEHAVVAVAGSSRGHRLDTREPSSAPVIGVVIYCRPRDGRGGCC